MFSLFEEMSLTEKGERADVITKQMTQRRSRKSMRQQKRNDRKAEEIELVYTGLCYLWERG